MNSTDTERITRPRGWRLLALTAGLVGLVLAVETHTSQDDADGGTLFKTYCSSCHGTEATGHGPVAPALRHAPSDLTRIAKNNGGMFPTARVHRIIAGRDIESHGDRDMPVWGDAFKATRNGRPQDVADTRIAAIVRYLQSIQQRDAQ